MDEVRHAMRRVEQQQSEESHLQRDEWEGRLGQTRRLEQRKQHLADEENARRAEAHLNQQARMAEVVHYRLARTEVEEVLEEHAPHQDRVDDQNTLSRGGRLPSVADRVAWVRDQAGEAIGVAKRVPEVDGYESEVEQRLFTVR